MKPYLLLIPLLLLAACAQTEQITATEKIKIGVSTPETGYAASTGSWIRNGIELALERLSEEERTGIELVYEDDQCNPATGTTVANKFVELDNIKFVMGPLCGSIINPTMPYYEEHKVLRMLTGVGLETNIGKGKYYFLLLGRAEALMQSLAQYAYDHGIKTVSIIYLEDEYGKDNLKWFEKYFTEKGGRILAKESIVRGDTDFRTQLTKIKETRPDATFVITIGPTLVSILRQMKELGIETKKMSLMNTEDTEIVKSAKDLVEGTLYPSIIDSSTSDVKTWFQQRYLGKYGAPNEAIAASAFDSFNILLNAIKNCGQDVECVKQTISQTKDYVGASGTFSVDEQGVGIRTPAVKMVKDGKFVYTE